MESVCCVTVSETLILDFYRWCRMSALKEGKLGSLGLSVLVARGIHDAFGVRFVDAHVLVK